MFLMQKLARTRLLFVKRDVVAAATCTALVGCVLLFFLGVAVAAEQEGRCTGPSEVAVVYEDASELDAACRAVADVRGYFAGIGLEVPSKLAVHFADRAGADYKGHATAHGYFDPLRSLVVIYRLSDTEPWKQSWSPHLLGSFMRHEIVHLAVWEVLQGSSRQLRREWHEFIAYALQLDMMNPDLRQRILTAYADIDPAKDLAEINEFSYGMNPQVFAVMAFKTYRHRGAAEFVRRLLNAEIIPPPFSYPFAVQPHEVQR